MKLQAAWISLLLIGCLGWSLSARTHAAVTAEHRKQIDEVKKELGKVKGLISRKEFDEAAKLVDEADQKLKQVAKDAGTDEGNKIFSGLQKQVEQHREAIAKKRGGAGPASAGARAGSFAKHVAPVLLARCLDCHRSYHPRAHL